RKEVGTEVYDNIREYGYAGPIMVMTYDKHVERNQYNGIIKMLHKSTPAKEICDIILDLITNINRHKPNVHKLGGDV
ncbi:MAG: hypothetical protein DRP08_07330, partial [Candidatus Aenigmatarchaeota archaeon]